MDHLHCQPHACLYVFAYHHFLDSVTSSVGCSCRTPWSGWASCIWSIPFYMQGIFSVGDCYPQFLHLPCPLPPLRLALQLNLCPLPPLLLWFCLLDLFISLTSVVSGLFTFCRKVLLSFSVSIVLSTVLAIVRHSIRVLVPFIFSKSASLTLEFWLCVRNRNLTISSELVKLQSLAISFSFSIKSETWMNWNIVHQVDTNSGREIVSAWSKPWMLWVHAKHSSWIFLHWIQAHHKHHMTLGQAN